MSLAPSVALGVAFCSSRPGSQPVPEGWLSKNGVCPPVLLLFPGLAGSRPHTCHCTWVWFVAVESLVTLGHSTLLCHASQQSVRSGLCCCCCLFSRLKPFIRAVSNLADSGFLPMSLVVFFILDGTSLWSVCTWRAAWQLRPESVAAFPAALPRQLFPPISWRQLLYFLMAFAFKLLALDTHLTSELYFFPACLVPLPTSRV